MQNIYTEAVPPYSYTIARWNGENGEVSFGPGIIRDIFEVEGNLNNDEQKCFWIVNLDWFQSHKKQDHNGEKSNITVWETLMEPEGKKRSRKILKGTICIY